MPSPAYIYIPQMQNADIHYCYFTSPQHNSSRVFFHQSKQLKSNKYFPQTIHQRPSFRQQGWSEKHSLSKLLKNNCFEDARVFTSHLCVRSRSSRSENNHKQSENKHSNGIVFRAFFRKCSDTRLWMAFLQPSVGLNILTAHGVKLKSACWAHVKKPKINT